MLVTRAQSLTENKVARLLALTVSRLAQANINFVDREAE
jgi:hypothetical protein